MKIRKFKTSQWIMVIIVLSLSQLLIHYYSVQVMSGSEVINYVSFAGTIVSIILAVLAIVYSFYQSFTQQNNVDSIAREIEKLKKTSKDINKSSEAISVASECLPKMLTEVELLPGIINATVSSQIKEQTGLLLSNHAVELKSFMAESMIESVKNIMNESTGRLKNVPENEKNQQALAQFEVVTMMCVFASYRFLTGCEVDILNSKLKKVFGSDDSGTHQTILFGSIAIMVSFIMTGSITLEGSNFKVKEQQTKSTGLGSFMLYSFKAFNELKGINSEIKERLLAELLEISNSEDELIRKLNEQVVTK